MKVPLADDKRDEWKTRVERGGSDHGRRRGHCRTDVPKIPARIDQLHRLDHNRVEWRSGQKFQDTCLDVDDCVIEVWQHRFVLAADPGGVEYDAGQIDELMAARFKKRRAEAAQDTSASRNAGGDPRGRRGLGEGTMAIGSFSGAAATWHVNKGAGGRGQARAGAPASA